MKKVGSSLSLFALLFVTGLVFLGLALPLSQAQGELSVLGDVFISAALVVALHLISERSAGKLVLILGLTLLAVTIPAFALYVTNKIESAPWFTALRRGYWLTSIEGSIGDSIKVGKAVITVLDVKEAEYVKEENSDWLCAAKPGYKFIIIKIRIQNEGTAAIGGAGSYWLYNVQDDVKSLISDERIASVERGDLLLATSSGRKYSIIRIKPGPSSPMVELEPRTPPFLFCAKTHYDTKSIWDRSLYEMLKDKLWKEYGLSLQIINSSATPYSELLPLPKIPPHGSVEGDLLFYVESNESPSELKIEGERLTYDWLVNREVLSATIHLTRRPNP